MLQDYFKMKRAFEKKAREEELLAKDESKEDGSKASNPSVEKDECLPPLEVIEKKEADIATALSELSV